MRWWSVLKDVMKMMETERELRCEYRRLRIKVQRLKSFRREKERLTEDVNWFKDRVDHCQTRMRSIDQQIEMELE